MSKLSSDQHPGGAILTIRVIKSFPYRNAKNLLVQGVDLQILTVGALKAQVINGMRACLSPGTRRLTCSPHLICSELICNGRVVEIATKPGWKAYQGLELGGSRFQIGSSTSGWWMLIRGLRYP